MKLYRLYTERFDNLASLVSRHFDDATLYDTVGIWQGKTELAAVVEIVTDNVDKVLNLAHDIRSTNNQHTVLLLIMAIQTPIEVTDLA